MTAPTLTRALAGAPLPLARLLPRLRPCRRPCSLTALLRRIDASRANLDAATHLTHLRGLLAAHFPQRLDAALAEIAAQPAWKAQRLLALQLIEAVAAADLFPIWDADSLLCMDDQDPADTPAWVTAIPLAPMGAYNWYEYDERSTLKILLFALCSTDDHAADDARAMLRDSDQHLPEPDRRNLLALIEADANPPAWLMLLHHACRPGEALDRAGLRGVARLACYLASETGYTYLDADEEYWAQLSMDEPWESEVIERCAQAYAAARAYLDDAEQTAAQLADPTAYRTLLQTLAALAPQITGITVNDDTFNAEFADEP